MSTKFKIIEVNNNNKYEIINFDNVARINLRYSDRIVLNFNHSITRNVNDNGTNKIGTFGGYHYIYKNNVSNYQELMEMFENDEWFIESFYPIKFGGKTVGYVNISEVSSIKVSEFNKTVIFNLSHSITPQKGNNDNLMSADSIISSFTNKDEFVDYIDTFVEDNIY